MANIFSKKSSQQDRGDYENIGKYSYIYRFLSYAIDCCFSKDSLRAKKWRRSLASIRDSVYLPYAKWGLVLLSLFLLHLFLLRDGVYQKFYDKGHKMAKEGTHLMGFEVRKLRFTGLNQIKEQELIAHIQENHHIKFGTPILFIDIEKLQESITQFGWVKQVAVQRILPTILDIHLQERAPIAIWKNGKSFSLIDIDGAVIGNENLHQFSHLPLVTGDGVAEKMQEFQQLQMASPHLAPRVKAASWVGNRRWDIHFDNGIKAMLPDEGVFNAWAYLTKIDKENHLLSRKIKAIDLRMPEQMILQTD